MVSISTKVTFRLAIGAADGPRSTVWRGFSHKNEVYVCQASLGKDAKFSLHSSRTCRLAFTEEEGPGEGENDRVIQKWKRAETPKNGGVVYALIAKFPTDFLSLANKPEPKQVCWIPAAPSGSAINLEFLYAYRDQDEAHQMAEAAGRSLISYTRLPNGEAFLVTSIEVPWIGEDFTAPGVLFPHQQMVISRHDPDGTGRPQRFTRFLHATDDRPLIAEEFGAYSVPLGTKLPKPTATLTPMKVLKRGPPRR